MQDHELTAWLGDTDLTGDQRARLVAEVAVIERAYPDPDDQAERDAAMSAAVQYLLGDTGPREVGVALAEATRCLHEARAAMRTVARLMVADGATEVAAAGALQTRPRPCGSRLPSGARRHGLRGETRYERCALYAQTVPTSQCLMRAARAAMPPALLGIV